MLGGRSAARPDGGGVFGGWRRMTAGRAPTDPSRESTNVGPGLPQSTSHVRRRLVPASATRRPLGPAVVAAGGLVQAAAAAAVVAAGVDAHDGWLLHGRREAEAHGKSGLPGRVPDGSSDAACDMPGWGALSTPLSLTTHWLAICLGTQLCRATVATPREMI